MNRKAQIGTTMTLGIATLAVIFIMAIFILVSTSITGGITEDVETESVTMACQQESLISMFAYLQTPVNVSLNGREQNITIANLIRLAYINKSYENILQEKTKGLLDNVYDKYIIHAPPLEIVSAAGRFSMVGMALPSKKPIQLIFGLVKEK